MNGKDLLDALHEIDDEFIVEARETEAEYEARKAKGRGKSVIAWFMKDESDSKETEDRKKPSVMMTVLKFAACAAVLAVLVGGGFMIKNMLAGKKPTEQTGLSGTTPKTEPPTEDPNLGEQVPYYAELIYNSKTYIRQYATCNQVGESLGMHELTGYEFIDENPSPFESDLTATARAEVFRIPDVSTDYAVAVKHPGSDEYLVYARAIKADDFWDYARATQLEAYMTLGDEFRVIRNGQNIKVKTKISTEKALSTLFRTQMVPMFARFDMPADFIAETNHNRQAAAVLPFTEEFDEDGNGQITPFGYEVNLEDENIPDESQTSGGTPEAIEFCKDKPLGNLMLVMTVDNNLCGWNANVTLYSGGWVVTESFFIYVGPEAAAEFLNLFEIPDKGTDPSKD
ncbi:MAG: hypothetical protein J5738_06525 [Lachnospiraceae bacterium]|nr:hypothetical protein [Lachnospiraceae bacterium]